MIYTSTRNSSLRLSFEDVITGLTDDGGLSVPAYIPKISVEKLSEWNHLSFVELSFEICCEFIPESEVPRDQLREMLEKSFAVFDDDEIVPVQEVGNYFVAELFHGPTFAFKDIALQFVGSLVDFFMKRRGQRTSVLVATSGDTGSAAIEATRGKSSIECFVLFPQGRISQIQELQMTTVLDNNIHVIAMDAASDDLDDVLNGIYKDLEFKSKFNISSINSINWGRIMLQLVHYFYSYFFVRRSRCPEDHLWPPVNFSIPSGAFGNGTAAFLANKMGLPMQNIIVATNENDILCRFFKTGIFERTAVKQTASPAIDIQVPYNLERLLFFVTNGDSTSVRRWMEQFYTNGKLDLSDVQKELSKVVLSASIKDEEIIEAMRRYHSEHDYLLDPHSAVGVRAAELLASDDLPTICLATAHPCKFGRTVEKAIGEQPKLPPSIEDITTRKTKFEQFGSDKKEAEKRLKEMIQKFF